MGSNQEKHPLRLCRLLTFEEELNNGQAKRRGRLV